MLKRRLALGALHDSGVAQEREDRAFDVDAALAATHAHLVAVEPRVVARGGDAQVEAAGVVDVTLQEFGHQTAPSLQVHNARFKQEQIPHVRRHAFRDVAQF